MAQAGDFHVPVVEVRAFHHRSEHGGSKSLVLRVSTGDLAVVKFQDNPQSTRALVGEYVGTLVGRLAGAPFPVPLLVRVNPEAAAECSERSGRYWRPGLQFGTVYHPEARTFRDRDQVLRLVNLDRLPLAALVELWLYNIDLKSGHLLEVDGPAGPEFLSVDHGHILPHGPGWRRADLKLYADATPDIALLTRLARWARTRFHFSPALDACAAVDDDTLAQVIASVPAAWGLSRDRAARLWAFLRHRRGHLRAWAGRLRRVWNA